MDFEIKDDFIYGKGAAFNARRENGGRWPFRAQFYWETHNRWAISVIVDVHLPMTSGQIYRVANTTAARDFLGLPQQEGEKMDTKTEDGPVVTDQHITATGAVFNARADALKITAWPFNMEIQVTDVLGAPFMLCATEGREGSRRASPTVTYRVPNHAGTRRFFGL